jgi:hypothetical protein
MVVILAVCSGGGGPNNTVTSVTFIIFTYTLEFHHTNLKLINFLLNLPRRDQYTDTVPFHFKRD